MDTRLKTVIAVSFSSSLIWNLSQVSGNAEPNVSQGAEIFKPIEFSLFGYYSQEEL
jgi:hypothetical protein